MTINPVSPDTVDLIEEATRLIVLIFSDLTDHPLDTLDGAKAIAKALRCRIMFRNDVASSYAPGCYSYGPNGIALINTTNQEDKFIAHEIAHELTHHTFYWFEQLNPVLYRWNEAMLQKVAEDALIEERICRQVSGTVSALPGGLQWNGKIGIPRKLGYVRRYKRIPIPSFMDMPNNEIQALLDEE